MSMVLWLTTSLIIFSSAALQSITGFGFALLAIPLLSIVIDPHQAIPLVMLISFCTIAMNIRSVWNQVDKKLLKHLLYGSLAGLALGWFVFTYFDTNKLKLLVSLSIIVTSFVLMAQHWIAEFLHRYKQRAWLFGTISGFLTLSVGMPGPPIVLYLIAAGENKERFRAISLAFLFLIYPITLTVLIVDHTFSFQMVKQLFYLVPFSWLGIQIGNKVHTYLNALFFRLFTFMTILCTGLYSLLKCLM